MKENLIIFYLIIFGFTISYIFGWIYYYKCINKPFPRIFFIISGFFPLIFGIIYIIKLLLFNHKGKIEKNIMEKDRIYFFSITIFYLVTYFSYNFFIKIM